MEAVNEACMSVYDTEDIGFVDKLFGVKSRISQEEFLMSMFEDQYCFLQPYRIRQAVLLRLQSVLRDQQ